LVWVGVRVTVRVGGGVMVFETEVLADCESETVCVAVMLLEFAELNVGERLNDAVCVSLNVEESVEDFEVVLLWLDESVLLTVGEVLGDGLRLSVGEGDFDKDRVVLCEYEADGDWEVLRVGVALSEFVELDVVEVDSLNVEEGVADGVLELLCVEERVLLLDELWDTDFDGLCVDDGEMERDTVTLCEREAEPVLVPVNE